MLETFDALLASQAAARGDEIHLRLLDEQERETPVSYRQLHDVARRHAVGLACAGVKPGDRVLLMLPTGLPLIASIYGCHLLGAIPVPLYPPFRLKGVAPYLKRLACICQAVGASLMVADPALPLLLRAGLGTLCPPIVTPEALDVAGELPARTASPEDTALIQFSSGSTGPQLGVVLTHGQILANCEAIATRLDLKPGIRGVSWLPLYHDMGLIGSLFIPLLIGFEAILYAPKSFLLDPASWPRLIARYGATISMGPNFAYQLLARRVAPEDLPGVDLSSWTIALNGAEPIEPSTIRRFERHFAPLGFPHGALIGVYGLAEMALGVTMPAAGSGIVTDRIDAARLREAGVAEASEDPERLREVAAVGPALDGFEVAVLGPGGQLLPDRHEGLIAARGPSRMAGYWRNPAETDLAIRDGWLHTGDMGYCVGKRLFITGRAKDLIIRGGRNYHPQELEIAAEAVLGVRGGSCVAFGVPDAERGTEAVTVAFETRVAQADRADLLVKVAHAVQAATGLRPDRVLALEPGTVPKTSSGKRQRRAARDLHMAGQLGHAPSAADALRQAAGHHLRAIWGTPRYE
jgi:acyl-CoA synthetase (AMP-forming)/AMP-acid ligase II